MEHCKLESMRLCKSSVSELRIQILMCSKLVLLQIEYDLMTLSDMCVLLALTRADTFVQMKPLNRHVDW